MNIIAITQARIGSSRLPGKVLQDVGGRPLLALHLERLCLAHSIQKVIVATTLEPEADRICAIAQALSVDYYQGSLTDVLDRFYSALQNMERPDYIVRVTSDCPLLDPSVVDQTVRFTVEGGFDYGSNCLESTYPDGLDVEVFTYKALEAAWLHAKLESEREHVTPYIWKNSDVKGGHLFRAGNLAAGENFGQYRLTVDHEEDLMLIRGLVDELGAKASWRTYVDFLAAHPEWMALNRHIVPNEGYLLSLRKDKGLLS